MAQEQELQRLEDFISKLLVKFNNLKDDNARLASELAEREATIAEMSDKLESNDLERMEIGDRVSRMLEKIEEWESGATTDAVPHGAERVEGGDDVPVNDPSRQGTLFKVAE